MIDPEEEVDFLGGKQDAGADGICLACNGKGMAPNGCPICGQLPEPFKSRT